MSTPREPINTRVTLAGLSLASPIVLMAGHVGYAAELAKIWRFHWPAVGAISLKTTTLEPRVGHAAPRVHETPFGLINAVGLENPGIEALLPAIANLPHRETVRYVANIASNTPDGYADLAARLDDTDIDAVELNISCPNTQGCMIGTDTRETARVVEAARRATSKPLIVKLTPNQTDIAASARAAIEAGADILCAVNTFNGLSIDTNTTRPHLAFTTGGVSGAAILPLALYQVHKVAEVAKPHGVPIIGCGGVHNADAALQMLMAGASAIGLGTVLAANINAPAKILHGIRRHMRRQHITDIGDLTGALRPW